MALGWHCSGEKYVIFFRKSIDIAQDICYTIFKIKNNLKERIYEMKKWYAVIENRDENYVHEWDYGSFNLAEAKKMCKEENNKEAYIAVIDISNDDPICIAEIEQDEF